eukprot:296958_1
MSHSASLNETSKIYFHIIDIEGNDFQWWTHSTIFQILEHDTFNTLRNKIMNMLLYEYPEKTSIIECLNQCNKLAIFIDKTIENKQAFIRMKETLNNNQSKIKLNDNIYNTIKTNMPTNAKIDKICIFFIVQTWKKLAKLPNMCGAQQIINVNACEFILIPSKLSNCFKYNSVTNSFNKYINNSSLQMYYNSKVAFNEKEQTLYVHHG